MDANTAQRHRHLLDRASRTPELSARGALWALERALRRVIRLLNPHKLRGVRRAGGLLLLRRNGRRRHLPVQLKRMRVPKDALHFRGGLLELCLLLVLQRMLHLRISVAL